MTTLTTHEQALLEHFKQQPVGERSRIYNEAARDIKVSGPLLVAYRSVMNQRQKEPSQ